MYACRLHVASVTCSNTWNHNVAKAQNSRRLAYSVMRLHVQIQTKYAW